MSHVVELEGVLFPAVETGQWSEVFGIPSIAAPSVPPLTSQSLQLPPAPHPQSSQLATQMWPSSCQTPLLSTAPRTLLPQAPPGNYQPHPPAAHTSPPRCPPSAALPFGRHPHCGNTYYPPGPGPPPPSQPRAMLTRTPLPQTSFAGHGVSRGHPVPSQIGGVAAPSLPMNGSAPHGISYNGQRRP